MATSKLLLLGSCGAKRLSRASSFPSPRGKTALHRWSRTAANVRPMLCVSGCTSAVMTNTPTREGPLYRQMLKDRQLNLRLRFKSRLVRIKAEKRNSNEQKLLAQSATPKFQRITANFDFYPLIFTRVRAHEGSRQVVVNQLFVFVFLASK